MRSPQTTGEDEPRPGISIFHLMFLVSLHSRGGVACRDTPVAYGPRHCGQYFSRSSAAYTCTAMRAAIAKASRTQVVRGIWAVYPPSRGASTWRFGEAGSAFARRLHVALRRGRLGWLACLMNVRPGG